MTEEKKTEKEKHPVTIELEKHKDAGANMLIASTEMTGLSDFHKPVIDKVFLDPNPQTGNDVYKQGQNDSSLLLTGHAIEKLAIAAGVVWDPNNTRITDRGDNYISFQAVGGIKKIDGEPIYQVGHYDIDFIVLKEELEISYAAKAKKPYNGKTRTQGDQKEYVDFCVKRDLLFKRKHKLALCETGAKNRVLRKILCLQGSYTKEELLKPFVVVRVSFAPNFDDPAIRQQLIAASIAATTGIYGGLPAQLPPQLPSANEPETVDAVSADEEPEKPFEADPVDEFKNGDDGSQIRMLEDLIKKKGYITKGTPLEGKKVEDLSDKQRLDLFDHLQTLKDNDLPW